MLESEIAALNEENNAIVSRLDHLQETKRISFEEHKEQKETLVSRYSEILEAIKREKNSAL